MILITLSLPPFLKEVSEKVRKSLSSFLEICVIRRAYRSFSELSKK